MQLLTKEQELEDKNNRLKSSMSEVESLRGEVTRLRRCEDELIKAQVFKSKSLGKARELFPKVTHLCLSIEFFIIF